MKQFLTKCAITVTAVAGLCSTNIVSVAQADGHVLKIGMPLAMTGGLADEGKKQIDVWKLWLDKINAAGGFKVGGKNMSIEMIQYDYQTDGKRAQQLAEKLITDDKVDVLMAPFGSGHTKIIAGVAERYQVPVLACVASSLSVYDQGFKYLFGTLAPNTGATEGFVKFLKKTKPNAKRAAIYGRDDVFPKAMAKGQAAAAEKGGLEIVYNQLYAVGTLDHSAAISAMKSAKPDWVYMTGYSQDLILGRKQMADLGLNVPVITMVTGPAYLEFTEGLGDLANGVSSTTWWHHATEYTNAIGPWSKTSSFYKDFKAAYNSDPDYVHGSCGAAADILVDAVQRAGGKDKNKIRAALEATDVMTFYGPVKFSANGMAQGRDLPIIQVQSGEIKVLSPPEIANAKMVKAN